MSENRSVTVTIKVDAWPVCAGLRLSVALLNYAMSKIGHSFGDGTPEGSARATSAARTDARDTYYMARDAAEGM